MPVMEITTKIGCENACTYCPQHNLAEAYAKRSNVFQMNFDVFEKCINKIPPAVDIHFSGMCEPWLNPECTKMLLCAYKRGHKISVYTSLVGMNPSDIDLLEPVPFKAFIVHLFSEEEYGNAKVNENYLEVLDRMSKSNIKPSYQFHGGTVPFKIRSLIKENIEEVVKTSRAGNIKIGNSPLPGRKLGVIGCSRDLRQNVLLPNGDVILCCMDYGVKHVLGNLLSSDYDSLFRSKEFLKIKSGLKRSFSDILCRYCDSCAYDVNLSAKIHTSLTYQYQRAIDKIRGICRHRRIR